MALAEITRKMKERATCSICLKLMTQPMSISCGHSYCYACLWGYYTRQNQGMLKQIFSCPVCGIHIVFKDVRSNKDLENLIEVIKELDGEMLCEQHGEQLQLFCKDEGLLICWRCERAPQHAGHAIVLMDDVQQDFQEKLQKAVINLSQLQEDCINREAFVTSQITKWKEKIDIQRQKIKSDFQNLQSFLDMEEKSYLWRLEKEEEQMLSMLNEKQAHLKQKSDELQSHILELEEKRQSSGYKWLQNVKDILNRSQAVKLEAPQNFFLEILTACNVSELYFDVRKLLRRHQVNVTLDPSTAHPGLILSEDRRQVSRGCDQENLDVSAERFSVFPCVLGCPGFTSGRHYFEVDVGEGTSWDLGVCVQNVQRDINMKQTPEFGFWTIRMYKEKDYVALTSPPTHLLVSEKPLVVGVFLVYEAGLVSFYDMSTGSHIFTFPKASFSDTLRPYFQVYQYSPLFLPLPHE